MKRLTNNTMRLLGMVMGMGVTSVFAGEAETNAYAGSRGTATASAHYDGTDGGIGLARTRTGTGEVNFARGLAMGVDADGFDLSFSHAIADRRGPAYAGTFNLSIGYDGDISGSYGSVFSLGGLARSAETGGSTRTDWRSPVSTATASGHTDSGGRVIARTNSFTRPIARPIVSRTFGPIWR